MAAVKVVFQSNTNARLPHKSAYCQLGWFQSDCVLPPSSVE